MKIAIIGTGYVGLVSGTCFAEIGHEVVCVDKDPSKIDMLLAGGVPIYEPGLKEMVVSNAEAGRLSFTTDLANAMDGAEAVFVAVGTPSRADDGFADLSYVYAAVREIASHAKGFLTLVVKSTVPVGTGDAVERIVREENPGLDFSAASNPEFLREGAAIEDFMKPDRIVIGTEDPRAEAVLERIYEPLTSKGAPLLSTDRRTSELTKYAANGFLAMKITFINEMADLCESLGGNIADVARGIGLDDRIGSKFLRAGPGYGGSCFPKDTLALMRAAKLASSPVRLLESTISINDLRKQRMVEKVSRAVGGDLRGKRVAVLGLTFKPDTDDMRAAPSLTIVPLLQEAGAEIVAYDPEGRREAEQHFTGLAYADSAIECVQGADAIVLMTEWREFAELDWDAVRDAVREPVMIDLRNLYDPSLLRAKGFRYSSIGRPLADDPDAPRPVIDDREEVETLIAAE